VSPDDLLGFGEVAEILKVARSTAARYTQREDFPAPAARLGSGPVWRRADVEAWKAVNPKRRPGRPPKPPA
jgi:predicted DNA-binding transcriptional regulator AlpA